MTPPQTAPAVMCRACKGTGRGVDGPCGRCGGDGAEGGEPPQDDCPMGDDVYCEDCSARPTCNVPKGSTKPLRLEPESERG